MMKLRETLQKISGFTIYRSLPIGLDMLADVKRKTGLVPETVFDVGANRGQSATYFRNRLPKTSIYSFEPVSATFNELKTHAAGLGVQCFQLGFGSAAEKKRIRVFKDARKSVSNSLHLNPSVAETTDEVIDIETIDNFLRQQGVTEIDYLKIDTEGNDLDVLKGAVGSLKAQKIKFVEVEAGMNSGNKLHVPYCELLAFLESYGFSVFGLYRQVHEGGTRIPVLRRVNVVFISSHIVDPFR